ncbi:MAG: outer membrane beta-barrel protein [Cyclobacteriaceae bacterium]|jgi:opacity protein-like surface antigen
MKPFLLSVIFVIGIITSGVAQFSLGAHVTPAFPLGDFGNTAKTGFGFDVEGRFQMSEQLMGSASIGYESFGFMAAGFSNSNLSYNITPITFSLLYILSEEAIQPYLGMGIGINRVAYEAFNLNVSDSHFGISPTFGLQFEANEQVHLDANVKYQLIFANNNGNPVSNLANNIVYVPFNLGVFYSFGQ